MLKLMKINCLPFSVARHNPHDSKTLITKYNMFCTVNFATKYLKVASSLSSVLTSTDFLPALTSIISMVTLIPYNGNAVCKVR